MTAGRASAHSAAKPNSAKTFLDCSVMNKLTDPDSQCDWSQQDDSPITDHTECTPHFHSGVSVLRDQKNPTVCF